MDYNIKIYENEHDREKATLTEKGKEFLEKFYKDNVDKKNIIKLFENLDFKGFLFYYLDSKNIEKNLGYEYLSTTINIHIYQVIEEKYGKDIALYISRLMLVDIKFMDEIYQLKNIKEFILKTKFQLINNKDSYLTYNYNLFKNQYKPKFEKELIKNRAEEIFLLMLSEKIMYK